MKLTASPAAPAATRVEGRAAAARATGGDRRQSLVCRRSCSSSADRHQQQQQQAIHQRPVSAAAAAAPAAASRRRRRGVVACAAASPETEAAAASAAAAPAAAADDGAPSSSSPKAAVPTSPVWELDFCSRPLLDERGKKVWELLITDPERSFEHSQYFPNSRINSAELRRAVDALLAQPGAARPDRARFFRGQMSTIITKALTDAGIKAVPSRRCFGVMSLLEERAANVYPQDPRYSSSAASAPSLFALDLGAPEPLPDALRGEQWAFVQLPLGSLRRMLRGVEQGEMFGAALPLASAAASVPDDALVPGVAVFSRRALPLAAWTNGLEIAGVTADVERACLVLETGVNQRWRYGGWRASPQSAEEARGWEASKREIGGLHFLAIQPDPDGEELSGLWLMLDRPPPAI